MFKKYHSIDNYYQKKNLDYWLERCPELATCEYVLQEKIHGCLSGDDLLDTEEFGKISIEDIVRNGLECKIKSYDNVSDKISYQPIIKRYEQNDNNNIEWFEIELENGKKVCITEEHYVWLPKENIWRKAKDLREGDVLMTDW